MKELHRCHTGTETSPPSTRLPVLVSLQKCTPTAAGQPQVPVTRQWITSLPEDHCEWHGPLSSHLYSNPAVLSVLTPDTRPC